MEYSIHVLTAARTVHAYVKDKAFVSVAAAVFLIVLISGCTQQMYEPGTFQRMGDQEGGEKFDGRQQALGETDLFYKGLWMPTLGTSAIP